MTQLLQMTVQGTLLIAVLLLLRALFRSRISPVILYALWLLPAARLLIPGSVESAFSLQNFVPAPAEQGMATVLGQGSAQVPQLSQAQTTAPPAAADLAQQAAIPSGAALDVGTLLMIVWALGAAVVLLVALWKNVRFARRVRQGAVPVEANCPLPVYLSEGLSSPCLCGLFRPAIFLCDQALDSQSHLEMALIHELSHWRAGDRFWAVLRLICCGVHWFNPLVWIAARACVQDCEQACDHRVLREAGQEERESYGMLLLSYVRQTKQQGLLLTSSPMGAEGRALRGRIALIAQKPASRRMALAVLALCVALTCLVACTGRLTEETSCQRLIQLAGQTDTTADMTDVRHGVFLGSFSGKSLANFLSTREWEQVEISEAQELELESEISLNSSSGESLGTLCFLRDTVTGDCYASVAFSEEPNADASTYAVSQWDEQTASAMTRIGQETYTLRSTLPGGDEMVLVRSDPATGTEYHWFFYTEDGKDYTPINSDLDTQYSRVAECMVFISREVGFVSFRYEGFSDPNLYRTEDGGVTWQRVDLPMGGVTTENSYGGIHVTAIAFEDERNGSVTVSMYYDGGQEDTLSCVFVTSDGGRTWAAITSGGPDQSD